MKAIQIGVLLILSLFMEQAVEGAGQMSAPTSLTFTSITAISMNGSFLSGRNTDGYLVLRKAGSMPTELPINGTVYMNVLGTSDVAYTGGNSAFSSLNLLPGTVYYYAIYSYAGSGSSINYYTTTALVGSQLTMAAPPVATAATNITQTSFIAHWGSAVGAVTYALDVALDPGFISILPSYTGLSVVGTGTTVTGILPGTTYYLRVKSINASGTSVPSNVISQLTVPGSPVAMSVVMTGSTNFIASWQPAVGAISYLLDVTVFASDFVTYVSGYQGRPILNGNTEELVIGLVPGQSYKFRVRAKNPSGTSGNSNTKSITTVAGTTQVFSASVSNFTDTQFTGTPISLISQISNSLGVVAVTLVYKGITELAAKSQLMVETAEGYEATIDDAMLDALGVEFYVMAKDETDVITVSDTKTLYRSFIYATSPAFISGSLDGSRSSMIMTSIPIDPDDNLVQSIFFSLGAYDKKGWRLAHYQNGVNVEYQTGINKIERGAGYWFNAKGQSVVVKAGRGSVGKYNQTNPFRLSLVQGWNQIGNPYPFDINWSYVLMDNPDVTGVSGLRVYDGVNENFVASNILKVNTGAFVYADNPVTIDIAVTLNNRSGRIGTVSENTDISLKSWQVPLTITQNNSSSSLGAIGMHPDASASKDQYDEIRLPRTEEFLDVTFDHPEYRVRHFARDIAPASNAQSWKFVVESSGVNEDAVLAWDNSVFGNNSSQLFLLDVEAGRLMDMRGRSAYAFVNPGKKEFRIYFRNDAMPVVPDLLIVGHPYPNPSSSSVRMNLILPESGKSMRVEMTAFDMLGHPVKALLNEGLPGGVYEALWDGRDASDARVASGLYLIRITVDGLAMQDVQKVFIK